MQVQPAWYQVGARLGGVGKAPLIAVGLSEDAGSSHAGELLQQEPALPAAAQPKFTNQLFITGAPPCGAADAGEQFAVRGHSDGSMVSRR